MTMNSSPLASNEPEIHGERQPLIALSGREEDDYVEYDENELDKILHARTTIQTMKISRDLPFRSSFRRSSRRIPRQGSLFTSFQNLMLQGTPTQTQLQISEAIVPLIHGKLPPGTHARPASTPKTIPYEAPYRRFARHRSFRLWWLNEFRHWWKQSRLLVRLGGMETLAANPTVWEQMTTVNLLIRKGVKTAYRLGKRLGQGGVMRDFLKLVQPFTRTIRLVVATWRWIEASRPRRAEVFVEEGMAFLGNRVSRIFARYASDFFSSRMVLPSILFLIQKKVLHKHAWHSEIVLILLGFIRAIAPYAASFQGSRFARVITRQAIIHADNRWLPIQRIGNLNLHSTDADEPDEAGTNDSLVKMARKVASALSAETEYQLNERSLFQKRKAALSNAGFHIVGCGSGGYLSCQYRQGDVTVLLHITPYGPSILDVMPLYIVLEREDSVDTRRFWSTFINEFVFSGPSVIEGYCYHGAFFSPYHFAELKARYDEELRAYDSACEYMSRAEANNIPKPPTDLPSLKAFLELGRPRKEKKKNLHRHLHLQGEIDKVAKHIKNMMKVKNSTGAVDSIAPRGVILYFEGLDCAGKSSTGGLIQAALERAGYEIGMRQYNRPPTPEQRLKPWMDRFERPLPKLSSPEEGETADDVGRVDNQYNALIWDRGPAGDFVYGALASADLSTRLARYKEFKEFNAQCRREKILFCKLLFVTDRDAIARTLGKRLAHRKIARDLRNWLDANHDGPIDREGLLEIENHIDPTDFVAFNSYHNNLGKFASFARNTDEFSSDTWNLPWIVVSTKKRFPARLQLLKAFVQQINTFCVNTKTAPLVMRDIAEFFGINLVEEEEIFEVQDASDIKKEKHFRTFSFGTCYYLFLGLGIIYIYFTHLIGYDD